MEPRRARRADDDPQNSQEVDQDGTDARRAVPRHGDRAEGAAPAADHQDRAAQTLGDSSAGHRQHSRRTAVRGGIICAVGFAALALVVGTGVSLIPAQQLDRGRATTVMPGQTLVCPPSQQTAQMAVGSTSAQLHVSDLGGAPQQVRVPMSGSIGTGARLVRSVSGQGRPTATTMSLVGSGAGATSAWTSCVTASTGGTVIVADPSISDLMVTNSESEDTTVDVSLSGAKGAIDATGSRGISIAAGASKVLPLSVWAPGNSPVSATVTSDTGRIVAVARSRGAVGAETVAMSSPAQNLSIPAVPAGATASELLVSNPGSGRATVKVSALAAGGSFTPEGADDIEVEPNSTIAVDLSKALAGEAVGLSVSASTPVSAQLMATRGKDVAMATPAAAATSLQTAAPRGGTVSLSNPTDQVTRISGSYRTVKGQTVRFSASLAAGTTWTRGLGTDAGHLLVNADHAVIGGVWYSATGLSSVPLSVVSGNTRATRISVDAQLS